jgi:hypothetical protein
LPSALLFIVVALSLGILVTLVRAAAGGAQRAVRPRSEYPACGFHVSIESMPVPMQWFRYPSDAVLSGNCPGHHDENQGCSICGIKFYQWRQSAV